MPSVFRGTSAELCGSSLTKLVTSCLRRLTGWLGLSHAHCYQTVAMAAGLMLAADVQAAAADCAEMMQAVGHFVQGVLVLKSAKAVGWPPMLPEARNLSSVELRWRRKHRRSGPPAL